MKSIQGLQLKQMWKWLVIGFWVFYAMAFLLGIVSLIAVFGGTIRSFENTQVLVLHEGLLSGIWSWSWKILLALLLLAVFATLENGKRFLFRRSVTWKLFGVGLALFVLMILFAPAVYFENWRIDKDVKSIQGPDTQNYLFLKKMDFLSGYEALGQVVSNHWYGQTCRLLAARYMGFQDYHPQGVGILFPKQLQDKIEQDHPWDKFIYVPDKRWVLVISSNCITRNFCENACILAYDCDSQKGYSEYSPSDLHDPKTTIHDLSPFILIGPDTPIDSAKAYAGSYIEAVDKGSETYPFAFPKLETIHEGLNHPNPEVQNLSKYILSALSQVQDKMK